ncbi:MAG TPA: helix-hairpin-helix domain-containing protein [Methylomirabilota bacterium]|nr:helix-hairpin-helix domain-containing protein [Methylomirabilota bacterium]
MGLYTRHQIALLLALLAAAGFGLAVRHWRATHPDVATRLERFDLGTQAEPQPRGDERAPAPGPLDLNRATTDDLARLPGVGPALAARIVAARQAGGFDSLDDLTRVKGLGRTRIERLRPLLSVGDAPAAAAEPADVTGRPGKEAPDVTDE